MVPVAQFREDDFVQPDPSTRFQRGGQVFQDLDGIFVAPIVEDMAEYVGVCLTRHLFVEEVVASVLQPAPEVFGDFQICNYLGQI